jgi:hypothetical protein
MYAILPAQLEDAIDRRLPQGVFDNAKDGIHVRCGHFNFFFLILYLSLLQHTAPILVPLQTAAAVLLDHCQDPVHVRSLIIFHYAPIA